MTSLSEPLPPAPPAAGVEPLETEIDAVLPGGATEGTSTDAADTSQKVVSVAKSWGWWIFQKLEAAGEFVASVLGLDESKYQYVIDSMTEEDWKIARMTEARRLAALAAQPVENMESGSFGGGLGREGGPVIVKKGVVPGVLGRELAEQDAELAAAEAAAAAAAATEANRT